MITVCRLDGDVVGFLAMLCRDDGFAEVVNRISVDVLDHVLTATQAPTLLLVIDFSVSFHRFLIQKSI